MSAWLKLNADRAQTLAEVLRRMTKARLELDVEFEAGGVLQIDVDGSGSLSVRWDSDAAEYVVDDSAG